MTRIGRKNRYSTYQCYTCHEYGHTSRLCFLNRDRQQNAQAIRKQPQKQFKQRNTRINELSENMSVQEEEDTDLDIG